VRIQLASDLHIEHLENLFPGTPTISPAHGADLLVLAGDIGRGVQALNMFRDWPVPVLYVAGNHEAYGAVWADTIDALREAARDTSVQFLEREVAEHGGVRFLGCTLWTDYRLNTNRTQRQLMEHAELRIADHYQIRVSEEKYFSAADALREHETSRDWLSQELAKPHDGKTVVVTHHGPHPLSVHWRYAGDPTNAAFASNLTEFLQQGPALWLHGHVHDSFDYDVSGCRVIANPRGYARNVSSAPNVDSLRFENGSYRGNLVVNLDLV
jgi:Icc-related predicted phosphoesterase